MIRSMETPRASGGRRKARRMSPNRGDRAVLYLRVSTARQADEGHSLDWQRSELEQYAARQGLQVVETIIDGGKSAKGVDRPGLRQVIAMAEAGAVDVVVATKGDRLSRNLRDLLNLAAELGDLGVSIATADDTFDTTTAQGKAMTQMQGAFAELEGTLISERTRDALAAAKAKGVHLGRPPVGWTVQKGELVPGENIGTVVKVHRLRGEGKTLQQIADRMNAEGAPKKGGGPWTTNTVARVLKSPLPTPVVRQLDDHGE